ncbi:MAG: AraC family transcriptional regulator [Faecalimonas sp.]|nr:AraC family transcriptional regulator [Faecalimonas sp.]
MHIDIEYVYYFNHPARTYVSDHFHNCYELCFYFQGHGTTTIEEKTLSFAPGRYTLYTPGCTHDEYHASETSVLCVAFHLSQTEKIQLESNVFSDDVRLIFSKFEQIRNEYLGRLSGYHDMIKCLTGEIIVIHSRQKKQLVFSSDEVERIREVIDMNFNQNLNIESLLLESGYSYDYIRHAFKKRIGVSPKQYLMKKRIHHSKHFLLHSSMCISEIAQSCGFCTSSQFANIFKTHEGVTPKQYRTLRAKKFHKNNKTYQNKLESDIL